MGFAILEFELGLHLEGGPKCNPNHPHSPCAPLENTGVNPTRCNFEAFTEGDSHWCPPLTEIELAVFRQALFSQQVLSGYRFRIHGHRQLRWIRRFRPRS